MLRRLSAKLGKLSIIARFFVRHVANNNLESTALDIFELFWLFFCEAGHAYSRIGLTTAWKKYAKSSWSTPGRFSFLRNQSRLAALDMTALMWLSHFNDALTVTPKILYSDTCDSSVLWQDDWS